MNEYSMEELIPIVTVLSEKYTSKESSSITYEKAQQLMEAAIYCIEEFNQQNIFGEKTQYLKTVKIDAKEAYHQGYELVINKVIKVKEKYEKIIEDFQSYGNQCLNETILKGIPGFLRYYDAKFAPQNHILTFDYPTLIDPLKQCGVDAVYSYVSYLQIEQDFLHAFSSDFIVSVLENYQNNYEELLINISSNVMRNIIARMIAKKPMSQKEFNVKDYKVIEAWVMEKQEHLEENLTEVLRVVIQKGYQNRLNLFHYFRMDMSDFSVELTNACKHNCLAHVIG